MIWLLEKLFPVQETSYQKAVRFLRDSRLNRECSRKPTLFSEMACRHTFPIIVRGGKTIQLFQYDTNSGGVK